MKKEVFVKWAFFPEKTCPIRFGRKFSETKNDLYSIFLTIRMSRIQEWTNELREEFDNLEKVLSHQKSLQDFSYEKFELEFVPKLQNLRQKVFRNVDNYYIQDIEKEATAPSRAEYPLLYHTHALQCTQSALWTQLYARLVNLQYDKGQVLFLPYEVIQASDDNDIAEGFPPRSFMYEGTMYKGSKILRIYDIQIPITFFGLNEPRAFCLFYNFATKYIPSYKQTWETEIELIDIIHKNAKNENNAKATIVGRRDQEDGSLFFIYWGDTYIFVAELSIQEFRQHDFIPSLCTTPDFPNPFWYGQATNWVMYHNPPEESF